MGAKSHSARRAPGAVGSVAELRRLEPSPPATNKGGRVTVQPYADFTGKTVIVTGAGSGIGRATARAFARAGAHVLAVGRRIDALAQTATGHPEIVATPADVCAPDAPREAIDAAIGRWGHLDVLVNNAGVTKVMPLAQATADGIANLFDLNVIAPSLLAQAALPHLRKTKG